ncbi:N-6 DNA methylase [Candidatus Trichorickettsia mobilis]|uniref:N-6 DNA methylase n=1 Tax=Candidatus Trichorickettsia mobilis TaxID=1346319 RepID=UPI00292CFBB4|nr:N-6 DNA methylase [Candidatus Trichorickettsia mobilis]
MSPLAEQQTEWIINNNLINKGWHIDGDSKLKNVYFQKPPYPDQQKKLKGKKPDYILYQTGTNRPIAIIEAKKSGINLEPALNQGTEYAKALNVPLVFAMNGAYCETRFVPNNKELILNGEEVRELLREREALAFLNANSNETWTIPQEVKVSRDELISQFRNLNDVLRSEGLRAGIERFSEFANILFLKLLSEDNKKSWWNSIKSQSNEDIIGYVNSYVIEQIQDKYGGDVFTPISIKNPQTLRHIIDAIDPLILSTIDTDIKGDAFEYFLEKTTSTENDLGEYFTPRNVVKTIISLVEPKFKESVYDPFCGTGGFLTEAFNYIKENNIIESEEDLKRLKYNTLYGREITTTARIAKMNMVLHGDGHSGIQQINTLINPDYILPNGEIKKFDVIVTNMPFSQTITRKVSINGKIKTENNISPLYYNGIAKNNGDAACVLHCLRALKDGGRMALVVPEGFLFRKDTANVRKFLLSKARLQSVLSLPQGTFLPYTGVKTDILYFTDAHRPNNQKNYWFFEAKNIGVTLDNHKRKIKGNNDLKKIESSDIKKPDKTLDLQDNMLEIGFEIIDLEKVKNNGYNLVGNVYRDNNSKANFVLVKLQQIAVIESGNSAPQESSLFEGGTYPFFRVSDVAKEHLSTNLISTRDKLNNKGTKGLKLFSKNSILFPKSGASTLLNHRAIMGCDGYVASHLAVIQPDENKVLCEYLYYILSSIDAKDISLNDGYPSIRIQRLQDINIPLPSLEEQQKIVKSIQQKEKEIQMLKDKIKENKQFINQEINKIWQLEEEIKPVADKSVFDTLIKQASRPF